MNRYKDTGRLRKIERLLRQHPKGLKQSEIARQLALHRSTVMRALPVLEEAGTLLAEDDRGRLTFFGRRR